MSRVQRRDEDVSLLARASASSPSLRLTPLIHICRIHVLVAVSDLRYSRNISQDNDHLRIDAMEKQATFSDLLPRPQSSA
jgi:hypothetical protein